CFTSSMKRIAPGVIIVIGIIIGISCHSRGPASSPTLPSAAADTQAKTPPNPLQSDTLIARNLTLDSTHAYSDLFLDTADLDEFISRQHLNDTLSRELHNFYNARNYQYAWFDADGLSEQALAFSSLYNHSNDSSTGRKWLDRELAILQGDDSSG